MKLAALLALSALALPALSAPAPVPDADADADAEIIYPPKLPCDARLHPCNTYHRYPDCSPLWHKHLDLCMASGCIQWIRDPKAHCYEKPVYDA